MKKLKLSFKDFLNLKGFRKLHIAHASSEPKKYEFAPNEMYKFRHPNVQYAIVSNIEEITYDIKRFTFVPDTERGTSRFAIFEPGQYISMKYVIGNIATTRPYSICSSFDDWKNGILQISIKRCDKGLTSNFAHDNLKVGDKVELSAPEGQFVYEYLRDKAHVIALAGGSGITPFLSIAKSIAEGKLDFYLTVIYGCKTLKDAAFKDEFDKITSSCDKVIVHYVFSDEKVEGYDFGFITKDIIEKFSTFPSSYFISGPKAMQALMLKTLDEMNVPKRLVRCELFGEAFAIDEFTDKPSDLKDEVKITVKIQDQYFEIKGDPKKTVMRNIEESGIECLSRCRSGVCGFCHSSLLKGEVFTPKKMDHLREADKIYNQIHLCSCFPITDITVEIAKVGENLIL